MQTQVHTEPRRASLPALDDDALLTGALMWPWYLGQRDKVVPLE